LCKKVTAVQSYKTYLKIESIRIFISETSSTDIKEENKKKYKKLRIIA
jgi:hypothetical protein